MKTLIIDTSSRTLYCILLIDGNYVDNQTEKGVQHSRTLNVSIDTLLARNNLTLNQLDNFALCIGTGSFTGIRIGAATIKGYLTALPDKNVLTFNSLQSLAYTVNEPIDCLMDAGKSLYYHARYNRSEVITPPQLITAADAQPLINAGALVYGEQDLTQALCQLIRDKVCAGEFTQEITLLYLRQPQAVEELHNGNN